MLRSRREEEKIMVATTSRHDIEGLLPKIRERRDEIERERKLPQDLVDELTATGIFKLALPRAYGGDEGDPLEMLRVTERLASADGSVGWCAQIAISIGIVAGLISEEAAGDVFADPSLAGSLVFDPAGAATEVEGGIRLSGRWRFASGVTHARWMFVGAIIMDNGQPRMTEHGPAIIHTALPVSDMTIHDTWYVSGLCGTGSTDVSCEDVFIPQHRVFSLLSDTPLLPQPLYRMPQLATVAPLTAVVALGIARAALDELEELAPSKTPALSMVPLSQKPVGQIEIARAEGELRAARALLYETVGDIWQTVSSGGDVSPRQEALCRIAANLASETGARIARLASTLAGGSAVYNTSAFQRHARDADVITHHMTQSLHAWEDAGRVLMGLEPLAPIF
jgi:alkylation response protein AidB-like acyl-CoA dehydrogenase